MTNDYKYPASTFEANPTVDKLLVFTDGNCFVKKSDADTYAKTTKREYIEMERKVSEETETPADESQSTEEPQTETNQKPKKKK